MKPKPATYFLRHKLSGLVMIITLLWLTVSTPVVFSYLQLVKKDVAEKVHGSSKSDADTTPENTGSEEEESELKTLSEYLYDTHVTVHHYTSLAVFYKCHQDKAYQAFHPDTLSPPPDFIGC